MVIFTKKYGMVSLICLVGLYEDFFFEEFLPYVENKYPIIGDKKNRAVAGLSMGGGGATGYGLWHADKFASVYAMSALMSIPEEGAARFNKSGQQAGYSDTNCDKNGVVSSV